MEWIDGKNRCIWVNPKNQRYIDYHDQEWGRACYDDQKLFEMLILECFQAGLSWECVLNKREGFRKAFDGFNIEKISEYNDKKIASLQKNLNIIRNRLKIQAAISNAKVFLEIQKGMDKFFRLYMALDKGESHL